jgi:hypothetical protein
MSLFVVNKKPTTAELHNFGWAMLGGFAVVGAILWCLPVIKAAIKPSEAASWAMVQWGYSRVQWFSIGMWVLGPVLCAASLAPYSLARAVYVGWMSVVVPIGIVVSTLLLTVLFVVVLPVFSLIRLKDPLRKRLKKTGSYWEASRAYEPTIDRMMRPF